MRDFRQYFLIISLLLTGLCFQSCDKESEFDLDILDEEWILVSVENDGSVIEKENKDYFRDNAYVLFFDSDTTFSLNTGVNYAGGKYRISELQKMTISSYHEFTEVATTDEHEQQLTDKLILILPEVYGYEILNEKLTLNANNGKIIFKVQ